MALLVLEYTFLIHLKHLGCMQNEYTLGMNVFYGQNIKNNSNFFFVRSHVSFCWFLVASACASKYVFDVDSKEQHNGWKATYAYTSSQTFTHSQNASHHKKKSKNQILFLSSCDWDFIGCKVIPTVFLSTRHVLSAFHSIHSVLILLLFSVFVQAIASPVVRQKVT